jgi:hypothetical protein
MKCVYYCPYGRDTWVTGRGYICYNGAILNAGDYYTKTYADTYFLRIADGDTRYATNSTLHEDMVFMEERANQIANNVTALTTNVKNLSDNFKDYYTSDTVDELFLQQTSAATTYSTKAETDEKIAAALSGGGGGLLVSGWFSPTQYTLFATASSSNNTIWRALFYLNSQLYCEEYSDAESYNHFCYFSADGTRNILSGSALGTYKGVVHPRCIDNSGFSIHYSGSDYFSAVLGDGQAALSPNSAVMTTITSDYWQYLIKCVYYCPYGRDSWVTGRGYIYYNGLIVNAGNYYTQAVSKTGDFMAITSTTTDTSQGSEAANFQCYATNLTRGDFDAGYIRYVVTLPNPGVAAVSRYIDENTLAVLTYGAATYLYILDCVPRRRPTILTTLSIPDLIRANKIYVGADRLVIIDKLGGIPGNIWLTNNIRNPTSCVSAGISAPMVITKTKQMYGHIVFISFNEIWWSQNGVLWKHTSVGGPWTLMDISAGDGYIYVVNFEIPSKIYRLNVLGFDYKP